MVKHYKRSLEATDKRTTNNIYNNVYNTDMITKFGNTYGFLQYCHWYRYYRYDKKIACKIFVASMRYLNLRNHDTKPGLCKYLIITLISPTTKS